MPTQGFNIKALVSYDSHFWIYELLNLWSRLKRALSWMCGISVDRKLSDPIGKTILKIQMDLYMWSTHLMTPDSKNVPKSYKTYSLKKTCKKCLS
jgi:hypothetical protein